MQQNVLFRSLYGHKKGGPTDEERPRSGGRDDADGLDVGLLLAAVLLRVMVH